MIMLLIIDYLRRLQKQILSYATIQRIYVCYIKLNTKCAWLFLVFVHAI